jgi:hypothetical protein
MWTPKRIILLASSFALFTLVYFLYSVTALGRINTLPPLPDQYRPDEDGAAPPVTSTGRAFKPTPLERKLKQAFGEGCKELTWPVLLELNSKSMVMAAGKCEVGKDGRIYLEPMSLALYGKKKNDNGEVEINTLRCKEAYIRFDRPVKDFSPGELNGRKVVEAELFGDPIRITNNHRTPRKGDDLEVQIRGAPLYYIEKTQLIKSSGKVDLTDGECRFSDGRILPRTTIEAEGLEMELTTSSPPPRPGVFPPPKPKSESISGVKRIVLKEAVKINMFVAGGGPLPGNSKPNGEQKAPAGADSEPSHIRIATPGRFEYRLFKDHDEAYFDVPTGIDQLTSPQDVTVERINDRSGNYDMLVCKHLELRLKRRNNEAPAGNGAATARTDDRRDNGPEQGLEIETAHATGPDVTLTSDDEKLDAHGTDFFHDATKKLTILKGVPNMEATKEDSLIQAPELRIQEILLPAAAGDKAANPPAKTYQQIQAIGPGSIHMTNKTTGKRSTHAYWNDRLLSKREGGLDVLILIDSARFVDEEHEQWLKAEELKVWLLAEDKKPQATAVPPVAAQKAQPAGAAKANASSGPSRRPHRLEALRNVLAHSPDLNIHDAARLVVHFLDVPPARMPPPTSKNNTPGAAPPDKKPAAAPAPEVRGQKTEVRSQRPEVANEDKRGGTAVATPNGQPSGPRPSGSGDAARSPTVAAAPKNDAPRPIDLSARSIEARVLRCEERMALDHLWAQGGSLDVIDKRGGVVVRQAPAKPGEEGVYIEGNTLDMNCSADGNVLVVTGDLARLKMDKIFILGPVVNIDQVANKAWVEGGGAMQMQSTTTLEGKPLARPVPLTVHWSDNMLFSGTFAYFYGNIQAEQDQARLACQRLQVIFDRPISLKEGMRGDQPAKVKQLSGDKGDSNQDVCVEDQTLEDGKLQKYQLLMGKAILMNTVPRDEDVPRPGGKSNDANQVMLSGPGSVRILQRGGVEMTTPGKPAPNRAVPAKTAAADQEMKLTYISFERQMQANSATNVASFWEAVRVLTLPCDDPHRDIEKELDAMLATELPEGAMYLRCNQLRVGTYQKPIPGAADPKQLRTYQVMDARGQIYVQGREFTAQCDHLTFDEEKDQVIFIGEGDNKAIMSKGMIKGKQPQIFRAKKIIYIRSTGEIKVDHIGSIDG